jgi:nucleotide-binding universal stress UspA family protein
MHPDDLDMWGLPDLDDDVSITQFGPSTRRALDSILVPVAGGPNSAVAVGVAADLARYWNAPLDLLTVVGPSSDDAARTAAAERLREHADGVDGVPVAVDVCTREDVVAALTERAQAADLVVIGGSERSLFRRLFSGTIPDRLARRSATPIFVVERDAPGQ